MKYVLAIFAFFISAPAFADPNIGTIRICRYPGITDINDHKSITVPAGSQFVQSVHVEGHDDIGGIEIKTLHDATLGRKPQCAKTAAVISGYVDNVPPLNRHTKLLQQFSDPSTEMQTSIVGGFN